MAGNSLNIIIIHESEIIQAGLTSVIQQTTNAAIARYISVDTINLSQGYYKYIIFISENYYLPKNIQLLNELFSSVNEFLIVPVFNIIKEKYPAHYVLLNMPLTEIQAKLSKIIDDFKWNETDDNQSDLSQREIEVLQLVAKGLTNKEIADKLFISAHTVITHRKNITEKLGIKSVSGLTVYAVLKKIIDIKDLNPSDLT